VAGVFLWPNFPTFYDGKSEEKQRKSWNITSRDS
jgi:hypothetical protein